MLDARSELDLLEALAKCPLLACNPAPYTPFLEAAPRLLEGSSGVPGFQAQLAAVLVEGEVERMLVAVLRAS